MIFSKTSACDYDVMISHCVISALLENGQAQFLSALKSIKLNHGFINKGLRLNRFNNQNIKITKVVINFLKTIEKLQ